MPGYISSTFIGDTFLSWLAGNTPVVGKAINITGFIPRLVMTHFDDRTGGFERGIELVKEGSKVKGIALITASTGLLLSCLTMRTATLAFLFFGAPLLISSVIGAASLNIYFAFITLGMGVGLMSLMLVLAVTLLLLKKLYVHVRKKEDGIEMVEIIRPKVDLSPFIIMPTKPKGSKKKQDSLSATAKGSNSDQASQAKQDTNSSEVENSEPQRMFVGKEFNFPKGYGDLPCLKGSQITRTGFQSLPADFFQREENYTTIQLIQGKEVTVCSQIITDIHRSGEFVFGEEKITVLERKKYGENASKAVYVDTQEELQQKVISSFYGFLKGIEIKQNGEKLKTKKVLKKLSLAFHQGLHSTAIEILLSGGETLGNSPNFNGYRCSLNENNELIIGVYCDGILNKIDTNDECIYYAYYTEYNLSNNTVKNISRTKEGMLPKTS